MTRVPRPSIVGHRRGASLRAAYAHPMRPLIAVILCALLSACSMSMPGARKIERDPAQPCTVAMNRPAADILLATTGAVLVAMALNARSSERYAGDDVFSQDTQMIAFGVPGLLMLVGGVASATHGASSARACREREL